MSATETRVIAQQWQGLYRDLLTAPPLWFNGSPIYDGPIGRRMRNDILPATVLRLQDVLANHGSVNFVSIGSALTPESLPAAEALRRKSKGIHINLYLQDPAYVHERGRDLFIVWLKGITGRKIHNSFEYATSFGDTVHVLEINGMTIFLDAGHFPHIEIPEEMNGCVVTFANVLNYLNWYDVLHFMGNGKAKLTMFVNNPDNNLIPSHSNTSTSLSGWVTRINKYFGFHTIERARKGKDEGFIIERNNYPDRQNSYFCGL